MSKIRKTPPGDEIQARVDAGETLTAIAASVGVRMSVVSHALSAWRESQGLPPHTPGKPRDDQRWREMLAATLAWHERTGWWPRNVAPDPEERPIGTWLTRQRAEWAHGTMPEVRRDEIAAAGVQMRPGIRNGRATKGSRPTAGDAVRTVAIAMSPARLAEIDAAAMLAGLSRVAWLSRAIDQALDVEPPPPDRAPARRKRRLNVVAFVDDATMDGLTAAAGEPGMSMSAVVREACQAAIDAGEVFADHLAHRGMRGAASIFTPELLAAVDAAALDAGMNRSTWMRCACVRWLEARGRA
ncbi:helicase associated domain-containing protein [Brooklawnia cerclae]|uniref:Helicase-associated domain-containing protein n=1 Tax=Brooklawnia cerclae TaxID=349934 RepID=A0ABX0SNU6_9ACTN|nr:helicase associated domain-containing protein [Brooklawnia cerclae]NIH58451.1 hypothetical protein [Brooklawnia cerclae]